ncbi:hypothetical protein ILYODFUR_023588 [Ilyodon furcidens]|uniref:Uncharacterized protein n=1 Tax=Ilyodon furcidens TaxID=33524 RepID=A0ABV0UIU2_9TELE
MLKRRVNHDSPTTSRDLRYSGWISLTPEALPPWHFLTTSVNHLNELLPGPTFYLCHSLGCGTLGFTIPVRRFRNPTSQPQPIGFFPQVSVHRCSGVLYLHYRYWGVFAIPSVR